MKFSVRSFINFHLLIVVVVPLVLAWWLFRSTAVPASSLFQSGTTLVVNSVGNGADNNQGNGLCSTSGGACTLRAALQEANALPGLDTITFNISGTGPHTIQPTYALPDITDPVIIDGTTQAGYTATTPQIELSGLAAGEDVSGLIITAGSSTVRGLIINHFYDAGILIDGGDGYVITGNFLGTDPNGTVSRDNGAGLVILNSSNNMIGGTTTAARNLISGNYNAGIILDENANDNVVQGNFIGTTLDGTAVLGNGNDGIRFYDAFNNTIGGTAVGAGNLISGNGDDGIDIEGSTIITGNAILGNRIGTDITGQLMLSNGDEGIILTDVADHTIGSNLISGNDDNGIVLDSTTGVVIVGNRIGVNEEGTTAVANATNGIRLTNASGNTIGGTVVGAGNLISGNENNGIKIEGTAVVTGNIIQGNRIGTDASGMLTLPNEDDGLDLVNITAHMIGGTELGAGNLISGNGDDGMEISNASQTLIQGNYIGVNGEGTAVLGNTYDGIRLNSASANTVGGTAAGAGNLISGNGDDGIEIRNSTTAPGNIIQGNLIGTDASSLVVLGNADDGLVLDNARNQRIGGLDTGAGNLIAGSGGAGVYIHNNNSTGNAVQGNAIVNNSGLGIDLRPTGVTANDTGDGDTGVNNRQNFPVLTAASSTQTAVTITGTLNSKANTSYTIEFFANTACDSSGHGEGERFLGRTTVATNGSSNSSFVVTLTGGGAGDAFVSATATDPTGNTSELGACVETAVVEPDRSWQLITTATTPPVVDEFVMAYDGGRDVVVLYGGNATGWPYENSTWEFDGTDWTQVTTIQHPDAVYGSAMVYDSQRGVMILFGGSDAADASLNQTWEYDGSNWLQVTPATSPPARTYHDMAYDPTTGYTFLFGGRQGGNVYNDTWRYDGTAWNQITTNQPPPARSLHALALNPHEDIILLFGGRDATGSLLPDLWTFDLNTFAWSLVETPDPGVRQAHRLVYDPGSAAFVLVGGTTNEGDLFLNDTWTYQTGIGWVQADIEPAPTNTAYHTVTYDSERNAIILFVNGETWQYK